MAYLSDSQKQHVKDILKRWEELGHEPSHKEFNSDPKVTNAIASSFGSYSDGVAAARYYHDHPELLYKLDPPPPSPPKAEVKGGKRRKNSRVVQVTQEPPKPPEEAAPLRIGETRIIPKVTLKTPLTAPEEPKPEPEEPIIAPPTEEIPEQPEVSEAAPPQEPEEAPAEEKPAEAEPATAVEPEAPPEEEPEESEESEESEETIPDTTKEVVYMSQNDQTIINMIGKPVILVNSAQFNKALNGVKPDISPLQEDGTAIAMKAEIEAGDHIFEAADDLIEIPIVSVYCQPGILKDKRVHSFPEPKEGTLLLVSREVIGAACDIGRDTDDLVYPLEFAIYNGCMYCKKLGKI